MLQPAPSFDLDVITADLPFEAYLEAEGLNASALKEIERSPAHYRVWAEARTRKQTPAMRFGSLAHLAVLEPERFAALAVERPDVPRNTKAGKEAMAEFEAGLPAGALVLEPGERAHLDGMVASVQGNREVAGLLAEGRAEASIRWYDSRHDRLCKGRLDFVTDSGLAIDLKTTLDARPEAFARDVVRLKMATQVAHYLSFGTQTGLFSDEHFLLLALETAPPFGCTGFWLDEEALRLGRAMRDQAMHTYAECLRTGVWPGYYETLPLSLPAWAVPKELRTER